MAEVLVERPPSVDEVDWSTSKAICNYVSPYRGFASVDFFFNIPDNGLKTYYV